MLRYDWYETPALRRAVGRRLPPLDAVTGAPEYERCVALGVLAWPWQGMRSLVPSIGGLTKEDQRDDLDYRSLPPAG
jgi:hypothetical protein